MNYIDEEDMYYLVIISKGKGYPTESLSMMLYQLSLHLVQKLNGDMDSVHDTYLHLIHNFEKFNEEKYDKPFRYYTEVAKRNIAFRKNDSKKLRVVNIL